MGIDIDDPIRAFDPGVDRAYSHTDGNFTIVANDGKSIFSCMGIMSLLDFFDPGSPHTERDIVFAFTDNGACVATNALS